MVRPFLYLLTMSEPVVLPSDYYLSNFLKLTRHAQEMYPDLLSELEHKWLQHFSQLSTPAKCLLVRLLSRKGEWFRSDKLNYEEIPEKDVALDELNALSFISLNPEISNPDLAAKLLTKPEMVNLFRVTNKQAKKDTIVSQLEESPFSQYGTLPFTIVTVSYTHLTLPTIRWV